MSWFNFGSGADAKKPAGSTVSGYGNQPYLTTDAARQSFLGRSGQYHDSITGFDGRNKEEVYQKAQSSGMSPDGLSSLLDRLLNS